MRPTICPTLPKPAMTIGRLLFGYVEWAAALGAEPGTEHSLVQEKQQRRRGHRQRDDENRELGFRSSDHLEGERGGEEYESKLTALRQNEAQGSGRIRAEPEEPCQEKDDHRLAEQQPRREREHRVPLLAQQIEIRAHADRDKEEPEQQSLERCNVGFELMAVLRVG